MLSTTGEDAAQPLDAAPEEVEALSTAELTTAKREPSCAACGPRADGPYFGAATNEAVSAQLLLVAAVVAILSVAGDAHGSATQARHAARSARAASPEAVHCVHYPQANLPAASSRWLVDCATMGISGTSANAGLGITALAFTVSGALAGWLSMGAAARLRVRSLHARLAAAARPETRATRRASRARRQQLLSCAA